MSCRIGNGILLRKEAAFISRAAQNIYFEVEVVKF